MNTGELLYEGKAKRVFKEKNSDNLVLEFKDSLTAFNAQKLGSFANKGALNRDIAAFIFEYLEKNGVSTHYLGSDGKNLMLAKKLQIIPLEVVVRNILAGSTAKKLDIVEGKKLKKPLVEFYFKSDKLQDPFISDDQALMLELATEDEIHVIKEQALKVNELLVNLFKKSGFILVDFKIEFGRSLQNKIILGDEITPDCCRLWDEKTLEKFDKDRFRRDLGNVDGAYLEVWQRLQRSGK